MQLAAAAADREPSQSGLLLPESVPVHTIDEHQLLTGALDRLYAARGAVVIHRAAQGRLR